MTEREAEHPSIRRVVRATWACLGPKTRRKIVISGVGAAILAGLDALGVGLLPALVSRFQGHHGGFLASLSTPALGWVGVAPLIAKSIGGALLLYLQSSLIARDEE